MGLLLLLLCSVVQLLTEPVSAQWPGQRVSNGWYSVVGSKVVRPNWSYHAAVTVEHVAQPTTVVVEISGRQHSGASFTTSQFVTVEPYVTRIVKFQIEDLGPGEYNLTARGEGGLTFFNTTRLEYQSKSLSIFIQTDRAVYKPGSKVQFRAVILDSLLKPALTDSVRIHVTDGDGNRVKEWKTVSTKQGVFSGELELSEHPVLGDWTIHLNALGQQTSKQFQVAEYVLPKFEVSISVPEHTLFRDSAIAADIRAKYTYGRPVKGEAAVTMQPMYFSESIQPIYTHPVRKIVPIDGKTTVLFDIVKELNLTDDYERLIKFEVTVEEALTGRRQNSSSMTTIHEHKYHLELVKTSDFFKPGLKHVAYVKVTRFDGTPVIDQNLPVKIKSGFSHKYEEYEETDHEVSAAGLIKLTFFPPPNATNIGIEASYGGVTEWFSSVGAAVSPSHNYIQASILTETPTVNSDIEVEVNLTESAKSVSYQVIGRGDILVAHTVFLRNNATVASWRFLATSAMAPKARLVVYYIRPDGEVVADTVDIDIDTVFQNFVQISPSLTEVEPGGSVELNIESKPNSYVGLLGVDQSVLILKKGNDIMKEHVVEELTSFDGSSQRGYSFASNWQGAFTAHHAFETAGSVVLTNGFLFESTPWRSAEWGRKAENRPVGRPNSLPAGARWFKTDLGRPVAYQPPTRPPLAGPFAFSRHPKPLVTHPRIFLHRPVTTFTWLFSNLTTNYEGKATIRKGVPDTITSWVISAFSVDSLFGLGLMDVPRKVKVFRPFFLSLDLPYSIVRGETVTIPVVVFNYLNRELTADITLENSGQFEFADLSNDVNDAPKLDLFRRKQVKVAPNTAESTSFMITATEVGFISIKVVAKSAIAGDAVERKLLVKPEGETQYTNEAVFIDLRKSNSFETNVRLKIPENIVSDSEYIEVSAVGDVLGPSLPNLEQLIKMPFGCGEQNMLNFVPNIVILDYLKNTGQLSPAIEGKCVKFMEIGYQRELTYRHNDGSFSAFGHNDPSGSTWLTAFVVRSFSSALRHIDIETKILDEGLEWLAAQQSPNGSFPEVGVVSHKDMQGGSGQGLALTAYTLLAFLGHRKPQHSNTVNKAIDYVVKRLDGINDTYSLAVTTYALHLANHPAKELAFNLLEARAKTELVSLKFWKRSERSSDAKNPHSALPNSVDVEMTAYALLTYLQRGLVEDAMPIMKWLVSQQNQDGGFASTQDTVIALTALSKLAENIFVKSQDVTVVFSYGKGVSSTIRVNPSNSMILQKTPIPGKVREVNITASGTGFAVVQVSSRFNVNVTGAWPMFNLDPQVDKNSDTNHLQLSICSSFVTGVEGGDESNMAVMEVSLPSGFTVDQDALPSLQAASYIKRVETRNGETQVVLYFDKMTSQEYCPTISAFRTHKVAKQRPVPVALYDYYDQSRKARAFYSGLVATECDICEGEDCPRACAGKAGSREAEKGAAGSVYSHTLLPLTLLLLYNHLV